MKPYEINQLAIWLPMKDKGLSIKAFSTGYAYRQKGLILRSNLRTPVTRYAKNYTKGDNRFSLCIISTEQDIEKIEKFLDEQSKKVDNKDISSGMFKLLNSYYKPQT